MDLGPPRQRHLLAVLALSLGQPVALETVIDQVWGEDPPTNVRSLVYTYVSRLRRVLLRAGAAAVPRRSSGGYVLDLAPEEVDLHRSRALAGRARQEKGRAVELLREATALWRGTPLAGLRGDWTARVRAGLVRERVILLGERFDAELALGRHAEIVEELSTGVVEHPSAEPLTAQLMLALYRAGHPADALAVYDTARKHLAEEIGEDPGPVLRELHQRILRRDPALDGHAVRDPAPAEPGTEPAPVVRPAQLPPDVAGFTGREDHLDRLDLLLPGATGTAAVGVLVGTAGIGKTALAVHWAHRMADRFPDGQLYINLRGFDASGIVVAPEQALRDLLEAFGVREEQFPPDTDGLSALWRSVLAGRRVLLILDNARTVEQIQPLLPAAAGCLTLVTTRSELPGLLAAGATRLGLKVFTPSEARQMLVHRLGADRLTRQSETVDDVIARCAGLPLALAVVAAHAAARPDFPLATLAGQLREEGGGLGALSGGGPGADIRAVFSWSHSGLSPEAARLFRLTGLHAGPDLSHSAAAHLAGLPPRRTWELLSELTRAHLLTEPAPGRFTSHDLLRTYAADLTRHLDPESERHAALTRVLDYYLHSAHDACLATGIHLNLEPPGPPLPTTTAEPLPDAARAMDWFVAERRTLAGAVGLAARTGFDAYAARLSRRLTPFLDRQGLWHEQAEIQHLAVQAAHRLADPVEHARALTDLARAYIRSERMEQAQSSLKQALELFQAADDTRGQARVHNFLGYIREEQEFYDEALRHSLQFLDLERSAGNEAGQGRALNSVGWRYILCGHHEQALPYLREALALQERIGDRHGSGLTLDSMGLAHHRAGQWHQAIAYYRQALERFESPAAADRLVTATTLDRLGDTHHSAGDLAAARDAWQRALGIYEELQHPQTEEFRERLDKMTAAISTE